MKKTYYIPTIEIIPIQTQEMMQFDLGGSGTHGTPPGAPKRQEKVF